MLSTRHNAQLHGHGHRGSRVPLTHTHASPCLPPKGHAVIPITKPLHTRLRDASHRPRALPDTDTDTQAKVDNAAPAKGKTTSGIMDKVDDGKKVVIPADGQTLPLAGEFISTRNFFQIASSAALESATDIGRHWKRTLKPKGTIPDADRLVSGKDGMLRLQKTRPVMLVLGSGWGAHSCIKVLDHEVFDIVVISPRNHFIFTPMLPSTAVGTVEFRSLVEPIRSSNEFITYFEANCDSVDLANKTATCTSASEYEDGTRPTFQVPYDLLLVAVGEKSATYGTPGVAEHCFFMKEISDTLGVRSRIGECFELAALPGTTDEDRANLLHFVVVGGGPTGVEFAGTLSDFMRTDLQKKYPSLIKYVKVTLLQSGSSILTQFDEKLGEQAMDNLKGEGVDVRTGVRVVSVDQKCVELKSGERINYGMCVWSCGNAARPLVQSIVAQVAEQVAMQREGAPVETHKLVVDPFLRVIGADDVVALGDCSKLFSGALPPTAQVAGQQGAYIAHIANDGYVFGKGGMEAVVPLRFTAKTQATAQAATEKSSHSSAHTTSSYGSMSSYDAGDMTEAIQTLEASQLEYCKRPFEFLSLGIMAYVGNDKALTQIEAGLPGAGLKLYGSFAFLLWRSVYITKQVSFRNRVLILFDWLKTRVFGRDTSIF